ncbi:MAG: 1-acyl-sn-glycerol-3-phosphate acyltransferase [Ruminococcaceae bacterium]|nr:1-acyl-sn-glycerol-3-phosphate acyltransferase [Oscillospiraceae bacterium]
MTLYERLVRILGPLIRFVFPIRLLDLPKELPEEGLIVCPNHISFFDPVFLAITLPRPLTFMAKEELFKRPIVKSIVKGCGVVPLSRNGGDAAKLRLAVRELKAGKIFSIFPQGTRMRHPLKKEEFKAGVGMMAALSGVRVLPVGIYSKNYKVRPFRKTYIAFGEIESFSFPEDMGKKEQAVYVTDRIFERICELEEKAREAAKK